ncbi:MAG: M3 family oligoendopeptidase [Clostridia bacterium]|nr:M3 family oligoendopeptidase [Clostridia bacterium]
MNKQWDLSILYSGFDTPEFQADMAAFDEAISEVIAFSEKLSSLTPEELLVGYIKLETKVNALAEKLFIYANLRYSANTADTEAQGTMGVLMGKLSAVAAPSAATNKAIAKIENIDIIIEKNELLREHSYRLLNIVKNSKHLLSDAEESLFAEMDISGASAWSDLQSSLTSSLKVDYKGDKITLSGVRNLAYDPDATVRREAFEAELAAYPQIETATAFALNSIKLQVIGESARRGYASPLAKALDNSAMKQETLDALLTAMQEYMPAFRRYLRAKAHALGHEGGLPWYDLFAPMGKSDKKYTTEDARDYLLGIFGKFDTELHDMVKEAFDNSWIDFFPREGKVGGAFDCAVHCAGQSRVLTNFDGSFSDIVTLAHELGHSFHDRQVYKNSPLNRDYSMPVAETASTFNETLVMNTAIAECTDRDTKLALIESQLMDATQVIVDIYSRYLFEASVFAARPTEFLSADRMCQLMLDAQRQTYGDGLDENTLHPYMWLCKGHYYSGGLSFYNYPYAFGALFARGIYAKYLEEGKPFVETYKKMLRATGTSTVEDAALVCGIDLTDVNFWRSGLESMKKQIDEFCELVDYR